MGKHIRSYEERIKDLEKLTDVQGQDGNWDFDPYMTGMFNGMEEEVDIIYENDYTSSIQDAANKIHNCVP